MNNTLIINGTNVFFFDVIFPPASVDRAAIPFIIFLMLLILFFFVVTIKCIILKCCCCCYNNKICNLESVDTS